MGIFRNILDKLGFDRDKDDGAFGTRPYEKAPGKPATPGPRTGAGSGGGGSTGGFGNVTGTVSSTAAGRAISEVDVMSRLEQKAAGKDLNWKTSIVDLLKLLDIDSSLAARKELADELGAPASYSDGSAEMNTWLHKEVLRRVAANGGNIPSHMLD